MSHEIEIIDGQALYAGSRQPAWHQLGTTVDADLTVDEALDLSYLSGWNVRTEPLTALTSEGIMLLEGHQVILRDNPVSGAAEPIAPIGSSYVTVQNEELAAFVANITDNSELVVDACGSLKGGARVFITLRTPDTIKLGGVDEAQPYLLVASGHDGGMAVHVQATTVRVVCQNTLSWAMGTLSEPRFTVRHTGATIEGKVEQARQALSLTHEANDAMDKLVAELLATPFAPKQYEAVVNGLFPEDPKLSKGGATRRANARDELWSLWSAPTQDNIKGSAWGAVQAVTEYADWYGTGAKDANKRAERQLLGDPSFKAMAVRKVLAQV